MKKLILTMIVCSLLLMPAVSAWWAPDWGSIIPDFDFLPDCSAINCADYIEGPCQQYVTASYPTCCQISNKPVGASCGTLQICDANGDCVFGNIPVPTPCDDGNACTTGDMNWGYGGGCVGTPINCDDGNPLTTDSCNSVLGCVHTVPNACDDGNACTSDTSIPGIGCFNSWMASGTECPGGNCNGKGECIPTPIVPEFGTMVMMLTALGALGIFFTVRRSK
ncbi:MAG: hypothetical protein ACP5NZ_02205 [Nanobdellota archaeon]